MPAFLGGLPGAALAMYHCARPENRHKIKGLLISGVIACVVGGTTEPIEFLFLFVAPVLYLIHAVLTGLGFTVMAVLGVTIGNTDGNVIDFVVRDPARRPPNSTMPVAGYLVYQLRMTASPSPALRKRLRDTDTMKR
jgi:phosphotransferase system  glucose/maltose/N-acetylglucosamine-specific IIC component